jgi:tetratricopeptide (TPR) repeat protein
MADPPPRRTWNDANERIRQGDFQGAIQLLQGLRGPGVDHGPLLQLLDLQVRLQESEGARETIERLLAQLPPTGALQDYREMQIAGAVAAARYRLQDKPGAEAIWQRMRSPLPPAHLALALFSSYRQAGQIDECLTLVAELRREQEDPSLFALELAALHEEHGEGRAAFGELSAWLKARGAASLSLISRRLLTLVENCDDPGLEDWMVEQVAGRRAAPPPGLGEAVLDALVQRGRLDQALPLAWSLDHDDSGRLPLQLARTLLQDGRGRQALELLEDLERRERPARGDADFQLLKAQALSGLGRAEESLAAYRRLLGAGGAQAASARLEAARLLHRPLGRPDQALDELQVLLQAAPAHAEALPLAVLLAGALAREDEAQQLLAAARRAQARKLIEPQLDFLDVRLAWWAGQPSAAAARLGGFLERQVRHEIFNDAVELLDLLAFAASDSQAVVRAGEADRLALLGRAQEALAVLHAAIGEAGPAREILSWRACRLAEAELGPEDARRELARYRAQHPGSIRLDRLAWMEFGLMERAGLPADSLRAVGLALLERWPDSLLQDAVRRRLRQLDEER